ncbi:MAG TPA: prepilin-type N-terminal cleavage/methylation domain-containing protein, partial [Verrucomicrobiae bacterium]|nr:prepilin-type N-terminal cleavage/methylation domain-containing protein [Verrucomicrobiae bacterium]
MLIRLKLAGMPKLERAFTLIEVMIGFFIFGLVTAGMIYGYVEANRMAEWSSQSLAAMSYAS